MNSPIRVPQETHISVCYIVQTKIISQVTRLTKLFCVRVSKWARQTNASRCYHFL